MARRMREKTLAGFSLLEEKYIFVMSKTKNKQL
jgi:hypothetical protein